MAKSPNLLDEVSNAMGVSEDVKKDNILRWDGEKLYVIDQVFRSGHKSRDDHRDVTKEVAKRIGKLLKDR
jgi:hypothetical protein